MLTGLLVFAATGCASADTVTAIEPETVPADANPPSEASGVAYDESEVRYIV